MSVHVTHHSYIKLTVIFTCINFGTNGENCTESLASLILVGENYFLIDLWGEKTQKTISQLMRKSLFPKLTQGKG